jgi:hypothetical protein
MTDQNIARIPVPQAGDTDEVEIALETSRSLWTKGDGHEALRWLRRAAEAAEQVGDDRRQLELARAAADLATAVGPSIAPTSAPPTSAASPPTAATVPTSTLPHRSPPSAPPRRADSQAPLFIAEAPIPPSSSRAYRVPPLVPSRESDSTFLEPPSEGAPSADVFPQPFSSESTETSYPPLPSRDVTRQRPSESRIPVAPHSTSSVLSSSSSPTSHSASPHSSSSVPASSLPTGTPCVAASPNWEVGPVRVSVKRSVRDETLLVVRPLEPGHGPPSGCQVGWLLLGELSDSNVEDLRTIQVKH